MYKRGFTLIELLVVIAIIGILSSVILASVNSARARSLDARRQSDAHQIILALELFYDDHDCLPITNASTCISGYAGSDTGGWDSSSEGSFMTFLQAEGYISMVPVDPRNDMTGEGTPGQYAYRYYCYDAPPTQAKGLHFGYWKEDGTYVNVAAEGMNPVYTDPAWANPEYTCR